MKSRFKRFLSLVVVFAMVFGNIMPTFAEGLGNGEYSTGHYESTTDSGTLGSDSGTPDDGTYGSDDGTPDDSTYGSDDGTLDGGTHGSDDGTPDGGTLGSDGGTLDDGTYGSDYGTEDSTCDEEECECELPLALPPVLAVPTSDSPHIVFEWGVNGTFTNTLELAETVAATGTTVVIRATPVNIEGNIRNVPHVTSTPWFNEGSPDGVTFNVTERDAASGVQTFTATLTIDVGVGSFTFTPLPFDNNASRPAGWANHMNPNEGHSPMPSTALHVVITGEGGPINADVIIGQTRALNMPLDLPNDATTTDVTWTSSAPGVATVSENGVVTGVSLGTAEITVTSNYDADIYRKANVTVVPIPADHIQMEWIYVSHEQPLHAGVMRMPMDYIVVHQSNPSLWVMVESVPQGSLAPMVGYGTGWSGLNVGTWFIGVSDAITFANFSRYQVDRTRMQLTVDFDKFNFGAEDYQIYQLIPRPTHTVWGGAVASTPLSIKVMNPAASITPVTSVEITPDEYAITFGAITGLSAFDFTLFSTLPANHILMYWIDAAGAAQSHLVVSGTPNADGIVSVTGSRVRMRPQGTVPPIPTGTGQGWGGGLMNNWFRGDPHGSSHPPEIIIQGNPIRGASPEHDIVTLPTISVDVDAIDFGGNPFVTLYLTPQPAAGATVGQGWSSLSFPATPLPIRVYAPGETPGTPGGNAPTDDYVQLTATALPGAATIDTIAWGSRNPSIATVDETGLVQGVSAGTAVIVARSVQNPNIEAEAIITVIPPEGGIAVTGVSVAPATYTISVDATAHLYETIDFEGFDLPVAANIEDHPWFTIHDINEQPLPVHTLDWITDRVIIGTNGSASAAITAELASVNGVVEDLFDLSHTISVRPGQTTEVSILFRSDNVIHPNTFTSNHNPAGIHTMYSTLNATGAGAFDTPLFNQGVGAGYFTVGRTAAGLPSLGNAANVGGNRRSAVQTFGYEFRVITMRITPNATISNLATTVGPQTVTLNAVFPMGIAGNSADWRPTSTVTTNDIFIVVDPDAPIIGNQPDPDETYPTTVQLTAAIVPANATVNTVTWTSSDPTIATVSTTGLVRGITPGEATITATTVDGDFTAASIITVVGEEGMLVSGITLEPEEAEVQERRVLYLEATVEPATALNRNIIWTSSDEDIAVVNEDGVVAGLALGTVTITATSAADSSIYATSEITVIPREPDIIPGRNVRYGFILQHSLDLFVDGALDYMDAFFYTKPNGLIPDTEEYYAYIARIENGPRAQGRSVSVSWRSSDTNIVEVAPNTDVFYPERGILTAVGIRPEDAARGYSYANIYAEVTVNGETFEVSTTVRVIQPDGESIIWIDHIDQLVADVQPHANTVRILGIGDGVLTNPQVQTIRSFPLLHELYIIGDATVPNETNANNNSAWFRGIGFNSDNPLYHDPSLGDLRRLVIYNTTHFGNDFFRDSTSLEYLYLRHAIFKGTRVVAMPQFSSASRLHTVRVPELRHITFRTWYYNTVLSTLELGPEALFIERPIGNAGLWFSFSSIPDVMRERWPEKPYFMTIVVPDYAAFKEYARMEPDYQGQALLQGQLNEEISWITLPFRTLNGEHLPYIETHPPYVDSVYDWLQEYYRVDLPFDDREIPMSLNFFTFAQHLTVQNAWWRPVRYYYRYVESEGGDLSQFRLPPAPTPGPPDGLTILDVITWAAQAGFDGIDVTGYYLEGYQGMRVQTPAEQAFMLEQAREIRRYAGLLGIEITGTGFGNSFTDANPLRVEQDIERYKFFMHVADAMGAPVVRVFAGNVPPDEIQLGWNYVVDNRLIPALLELVDYIEQNNFDIILGVQNHGDIISTENQALYLFHRLYHEYGVTNVGLLQDTGYWRGYQSLQSNIYDWYHAIQTTLPVSVNFQLKKKPAGAGTAAGWLDLDRVFRDIRLSGYQGSVPIELLWGGAGLDNDLHYSPDPNITWDNIDYWNAQFGRATAQRVANEAAWFLQLAREAERRSLNSNMDILAVAGNTEIDILPTNRTVRSPLNPNVARPVYGSGTAADPRVREVTVSANALTAADIQVAPGATATIYASSNFASPASQVSLSEGQNAVFVRVVSANRYTDDFPRHADGTPTWDQVNRTWVGGALTVRTAVQEATFYRVHVIVEARQPEPPTEEPPTEELPTEELPTEELPTEEFPTEFFPYFPPSGGGYVSTDTTPSIPQSAPSAPAVTETISVTGGAAANVRITGERAVVQLTTALVEEIIATDEDVATFDLTSLDITSAVIPRSAIRQFVGADMGIEMAMPQGTITLSANALEALAQQAHTANITFRITEMIDTRLPASLAARLPEGAVAHQVSISSGSRAIRDFGDATVTISLPFEGLPPVLVWRVGVGGRLIPIEAEFDEVSGVVVFDTNVLGMFVVGGL